MRFPDVFGAPLCVGIVHVETSTSSNGLFVDVCPMLIAPDETLLIALPDSHFLRWGVHVDSLCQLLSAPVGVLRVQGFSTIRSALGELGNHDPHIIRA